MSTIPLHTHLCQPHRLPSRAACDAEALVLQSYCVLTSWDERTGVCELREAQSPRAGGSKARDELQRCVRARRASTGASQLDGTLSTSGASSRVAIVESMTSNYFSAPGVPLKEEHRRTARSIDCWARRHNYSLLLHAVPHAELKRGYSAPYGPKRLWRGVPFDKINDVRHRVVASHLEPPHAFDHVLHIDTDTIALNESRSLRRFLHHPAAVQFQVRENGEVAAATYIARRSPEAICFLQLWDTLGQLTHRNPRPMLNTDNGVLLMLVARLLDEPSALACEAAAVRGRANYLSAYLPCFAERLTPSLLLHRTRSHHAHVPWLRFLFPREGWQRSFESPAPGERQHHSLASFQPAGDLLGHGWKAMGRLMVVPPGDASGDAGRCAPLQRNASGCPTLTRATEQALAVEMCWWLHRQLGAAACRACAERDATSGRVYLKYKRIGFGAGGRQELYEHALNLSERDLRNVFGARGC